ncbi:hypothetical protein RB653_000362 [Dictyostelium firmibasis]|uniref:DUF4476 domain-containing protein n=1 Tax=Dictyostelium firmibasis TaxID=79012 RepID=A0AAN7U352_9MYCE
MEIVTEKDLKNIEEQLKSVIRDQDRFRLIKANSSSFIFSSEQVKRLVKVQHYGDSKIKTAIILYAHCPDKQNYQIVIDEFYDDEKKQIKKELGI